MPSTCRVQFLLPDGSDFYLQVLPDADGQGTLQAVQTMGQAESAALELEMSYNTLSDIIGGTLSARHAFLLGDIRYSGDRQLAAALADLFSTS
ncbi:MULTISPECIES: SCP2 sterol-binding domain-containing protein [Microbulbifer]|uniref:SCP2 sterol-binding domain-containing protein n=1 Tax=Microbulbifer celer TaxID=435905 RepID=A0ABW3UDG8_9GAMM|nr:MULTISPECIES: SCP2 sterol-binding domain-containing protein [Microbulbifer]UFN59090.1 SCP2 sterol-binding domain-containing protein [Microbulbifer celer]